MMFFILPFMFQKSVQKLKFVSLLGILSIIVMILSTVLRYIKSSKQSLPEYYSGKSNILKNIGLFVFGYTCHQNIFTVQSSLNDRRYFNLILILTLLSAMSVYFTFGILNYKLFGNLTKENILNVLPDDKLGQLVRIFYGISLLFTVSLQVVPCKYHLAKVVNINQNILATGIFIISFLMLVFKIKIDLLINLVGGIFHHLLILYFLDGFI